MQTKHTFLAGLLVAIAACFCNVALAQTVSQSTATPAQKARMAQRKRMAEAVENLWNTYRRTHTFKADQRQAFGQAGAGVYQDSTARSFVKMFETDSAQIFNDILPTRKNGIWSTELRSQPVKEYVAEIKRNFPNGLNEEKLSPINFSLLRLGRGIAEVAYVHQVKGVFADKSDFINADTLTMRINVDTLGRARIASIALLRPLPEGVPNWGKFSSTNRPTGSTCPNNRDCDRVPDDLDACPDVFGDGPDGCKDKRFVTILGISGGLTFITNKLGAPKPTDFYSDKSKAGISKEGTTSGKVSTGFTLSGEIGFLAGKYHNFGLLSGFTGTFTTIRNKYQGPVAVYSETPKTGGLGPYNKKVEVKDNGGSTDIEDNANIFQLTVPVLFHYSPAKLFGYEFAGNIVPYINAGPLFQLYYLAKPTDNQSGELTFSEAHYFGRNATSTTFQSDPSTTNPDYSWTIDKQAVEAQIQRATGVTDQVELDKLYDQYIKQKQQAGFQVGTTGTNGVTLKRDIKPSRELRVSGLFRLGLQLRLPSSQRVFILVGATFYWSYFGKGDGGYNDLGNWNTNASGVSSVNYNSLYDNRQITAYSFAPYFGIQYRLFKKYRPKPHPFGIDAPDPILNK